MIRIILFLLLIALGAAGAAWIAEQPGDVVLSWGGCARSDHAAGVRAGARHRRRRGDDAVGDPARPVAHAGAHAPQPARTASGPRPACDHARTAGDRPWRFLRRAHACRDGAQTCGARSAGAAAACAVGAARRRPRGRAARLPRHGRARGHAAAGPARPVHRGAARRRSGGGRDGRRGSAEDCRRPRHGRRMRCSASAAPRATGPAR